MDEKEERIKEHYPKLRKKATKLSHKEHAHIVSQHLKGVRNVEIAREMNLSKGAITNVLKKFAPIFENLPDVRGFTKIRADIIDSVLLQTLKTATDKNKHEEARLGEVAKLIDTLHRASRLERGQSTENTSSFVEIRKEPKPEIIEIEPEVE